MGKSNKTDDNKWSGKKGKEGKGTNETCERKEEEREMDGGDYMCMEESR